MYSALSKSKEKFEKARERVSNSVVIIESDSKASLIFGPNLAKRLSLSLSAESILRILAHVSTRTLIYTRSCTSSGIACTAKTPSCQQLNFVTQPSLAAPSHLHGIIRGVKRVYIRKRGHRRILYTCSLGLKLF